MRLRHVFLLSVPLAVCAAFALLASGALAAEYYVSPDGSDAGAGGRAAPFRTLSKVVSALAPGDTLIIAEGVYPESVTLSIRGGVDAPVVIKGAGSVVIQATGRDGILLKDCSYVTIENLKITGAERAGILMGGCDHITIRGCVCGDNGVWGIQTAMSKHITVEKCELYGSKKEHGLYFSTTDYPTAADNFIHDNSTCGIHMNGDLSEGGDGLIVGATIARNKIQRCGASGGAAINMDGVEKSLIERNVIDHNLAGGITSFKGDGLRGGTDNRIIGNLVRFESGAGRYGIQLLNGSKRATLVQNIIEIDNGFSVEVDKPSAKAFTASRNFYTAPADKLKFSWKGEALDFDGWQDATGQDLDSHLKKIPRLPSTE
ncbi:MAG: right-handed parallel beta-helix repeat-containing protein [Planctomycetota bacterium]|jgi:parallel beta-helix repeat protein